MDMIIRNGTVVSAAGSYKADVAVKDGKIAAVGSIPDIPGAKVVDAAGKLVLPGAIDAHTHLAMPFGGTVSSDDYFAGTRAAACGGTTTVFDFALQDFNETIRLTAGTPWRLRTRRWTIRSTSASRISTETSSTA